MEWWHILARDAAARLPADPPSIQSPLGHPASSRYHNSRFIMATPFGQDTVYVNTEAWFWPEQLDY